MDDGYFIEQGPPSEVFFHPNIMTKRFLRHILPEERSMPGSSASSPRATMSRRAKVRAARGGCGAQRFPLSQGPPAPPGDEEL